MFTLSLSQISLSLCAHLYVIALLISRRSPIFWLVALMFFSRAKQFVCCVYTAAVGWWQAKIFPFTPVDSILWTETHSNIIILKIWSESATKNLFSIDRYFRPGIYITERGALHKIVECLGSAALDRSPYKGICSAFCNKAIRKLALFALVISSLQSSLEHDKQSTRGGYWVREYWCTGHLSKKKKYIFLLLWSLGL